MVPGNTLAYLLAWSAAFEQHYRKGVADFLRRHGKTTRIIPMRKERVLGTSIEYTVKAYHNRSTRVSTDLMDPMPDPAPGEYITFTVNFDHNDPLNNDFAAFEVGFRTTVYDLWKRSDRTFKDSPDFIRKDVQEGLDDVKETFAKYIHMPNDGRLAVVDLSPTNPLRNDDNDLFADCTDYSANRDSAILTLVDGPIARIGDGQRIEIRDSGNLVIDDVRVSFVHPFDQSISIEAPEGENFNGLNTAMDNAAQGDIEIFLSGSFDEAPSGTLANLFSTDNYYGVIRVDDGSTNYNPESRMLLPIRIDAAGTGADVPLTADLFRRVGESVGWQQGGHAEMGRMAMIMSRFEYRSIASFVKDEGITLTPALESDIGRKLNKAFGFDGFMLHDPNLGSQMMVVDDFAEAGQIDFLNTAQWEQATPIDGGFRMFPGELAGIWSRNTEQDVNFAGQPSKVYSANGIMLAAFVCRWPKGQIRLQGLATT